MKKVREKHGSWSHNWNASELPWWVHKYFGNRYDYFTTNPFKQFINLVSRWVWNTVADYQVTNKQIDREYCLICRKQKESKPAKEGGQILGSHLTSQ